MSAVYHRVANPFCKLVTIFSCNVVMKISGFTGHEALKMRSLRCRQIAKIQVNLFANLLSGNLTEIFYHTDWYTEHLLAIVVNVYSPLLDMQSIKTSPVQY